MSTVTGTVHVIGDTQTFGQRGFRKRQVVLTQDDGKYTNFIPVDFTRDTTDAADELDVGDVIDVDYRLTGRKWQRDEQSEVRYFVSLEVVSFKIREKASGPRENVFGEPPPEIPDRPIEGNPRRAPQPVSDGPPDEPEIPF